MDNYSEMLKGILEGYVLEILRKEQTYGYEILRRLRSLGFSEIAEGTVYALLLRLEREKLLTIVKKPSVIGPPRKFYSLNQKGQKELAAFRERWAFLVNTMADLRTRDNPSI